MAKDSTKRPRRTPLPPGVKPNPRAKGNRPTDSSTSSIDKLSLTELSTWPTMTERMAELFLGNLTSELEDATERAAAVLGALFVQDAVTDLVRCHLVNRDPDTLKELTGPRGPLYSFHHTTLIALGLGLISDDTAAHLHSIRQIRNAFSHSFRPISFGTKAIFDECEKLSRLPPSKGNPLVDIVKPPSRANMAQRQFIGAVRALTTSLSKAAFSELRKNRRRNRLKRYRRAKKAG